MLAVRHLRLRASTGEGLFGADLRFSDGLNVLWAENSRGKSTAIRGLIYALGLERMITTRPQQALTSAMRDSLIFDPVSLSETPVLSSSVSAELDFGERGVLTVRRQVVGGDLKPNLVRVWDGPALSTGEYPAQFVDYFVGSGTTISERGFHRLLAGRLGWEMPELETLDGGARLYLEQVFPLLLVEQQRGWGGIQAQTPTFSGPPDVRRRALQFLFDLKVGAVDAERMRLRREERRLNDLWTQKTVAFETLVQGEGLVLTGVPASIIDSWPTEPAPRIRMPVGERDWLDLDEVLAGLRSEFHELDRDVAPSEPGSNDKSERRLAEALTELEELRQLDGLLREQLARDHRELGLLDARHDALDRDRREHQDIVLLNSLGSPELERLHEDCPTCHQPLSTATLAPGATKPALSPVETLEYIKQQIDLVDVMRKDGTRAFAATSERLAALRGRMREAQRLIRALRADLVTPDAMPRREHVERRLRVADRIQRLETIDERLASFLGDLERLTKEVAPVRAALKALPRGKGLPDDDAAKLASLEVAFLSQLREYGFGSFAEARLAISSTDYLPKREEFDLQADISASDLIRVIWAYLLGIFEISRTQPTMHPRWLLLDEPRQQSAREVSFQALLARAGAAADDGGQIIFATSEDRVRLEGMLEGTRHTLLIVSDYLLRPLGHE
jgi:hypothetical protein